MASDSAKIVALDHATRGRLQEALDLAALEAPGSPYRLAVGAVHALCVGEMPGDLETARRLSRGPSEYGGVVTSACVWTAVQHLDVETLRAVVDCELGATLPGRIAGTWLALVGADWPRAQRLAAELESDAKEARAPEPVVVGATLRALALLCAGELAEGTKEARRASRMARTEGLRQAGYLSGLVLARARRRSGFPFLATFIHERLSEAASPGWRRWIDIEHALASGGTERGGPVNELLAAVRRGDGTATHRATRATEAVLGPLGWWQYDLALLRRVVLGRAEVDAGERVAAWCAGELHEPPEGIVGFAGTGQGLEHALAAVWTSPDHEPQRLLRFTAPWFSENRGVSTTAVRELQRRKGRTGPVIAALALAGRGGLTLQRLFALAYGFPFVRRRHYDNLKVVLSRARKELTELAEIEHGDGVVRMRPLAPLVVPDPRCEHRLEDRVLQVLARGGDVTARHAAAELGVSLRLSQRAIEELRERGLCAAQRDGRQVHYTLEDTTFAPPTEPDLEAP